MAEPTLGLADLEREESLEEKIERSLKEKTAAEVKCVCAYCGDFMVRERRPQFNRGFGIGLLIVGIILSLFMLFVGLPLVVIGAYMGTAAKSVWVCRLCAAMVDRDGN